MDPATKKKSVYAKKKKKSMVIFITLVNFGKLIISVLPLIIIHMDYQYWGISRVSYLTLFDKLNF